MRTLARTRQECEDCTEDVWSLNEGQVYTTLQPLERDGLVESVDGADDGPQRDYRITGEGRQELDRWLRTPPEPAPPRDELVIKVLVALLVPGVGVAEAPPGSADAPARPWWPTGSCSDSRR